MSSQRSRPRQSVHTPGLPPRQLEKRAQVSLPALWLIKQSGEAVLFSFFLLDFCTWSSVSDLMALFGGGRGLPGHSTQQTEARGSRVCLPQQVQSGLGSDLCPVPYVRSISPHMSFSRFPLAWGWIWEH